MSQHSNVINESKIVIYQGQQLWHLHKMLSEYSEEEVVPALAHTYMEVGRVKTYSEGIVLAASAISTYRSTECGERVMQVTRSRLNCKNKENHINKIAIET